MTRGYNQQQKVGLLNVIMTPIIILVIATAILIYNLVSLIGVLVNGGEIVYDQTVLDEYVSKAYNGAYETSSAKESGLAIIFFHNEDTNAVEYLVSPGSNISSYVTEIFGTESEFGKYLNENVHKDSYKETLASDLSSAIIHMADKVAELDLISNFVKNHDLSNMPVSHLVDNTAFALDASTVNSALNTFTEATGIPVVMVVDSAEAVFGRTIPTTDILMVVLILVVIGLVTASMVKKIKAYKTMENDFGTQSENRIHVNARSPYYDEDDEDEAEQTEPKVESTEDEE